MPVGCEDSWLSSHPTGLRSLLNYIKEKYDNPEVFITENGCMDTPGEGDNDITRMRYLRDHIAAVSQAIKDGCNIVGYTLWSLIDNFEWSDGYTNLFGVHKVDFSSPSRPRTPKSSAKLYKEIIRNNSVALIEVSFQIALGAEVWNPQRGVF
ncbi:glycosyl hydrolase, family 1 [Ancylostoma caninum]|uniref:Glycosyl hydrolase, family 1 n=1 Tax=Ancylostoma caninum TaxID=29170 RepID=A0A368FSJ9_ANCCA|nr:glycosyl hydrolase, family 1 [Ancylostoma caninum]